MHFRCLTNFQVGRRKFSCTKSPAFSFVSLARNHKHRFFFYFGRRAMLANRLLSSKAFFKCNCKLQCRRRIFLRLRACYTYFSTNMSYTKLCVFSPKSRFEAGPFKGGSADEEILLVVVYVRGMNVYPVCGFFLFQTRSTSLQHIGSSITKMFVCGYLSVNIFLAVFPIDR